MLISNLVWHPVIESLAQIKIFAKTRWQRHPSWIWKNSDNFAQDWEIWLQFCVFVQNNILNWITWPKCHLTKIQDGGGWRLEFHQKRSEDPRKTCQVAKPTRKSIQGARERLLSSWILKIANRRLQEMWLLLIIYLTLRYNT